VTPVGDQEDAAVPVVIPVVVLVGPPGANVAEVGRRLGHLLAVPVRDTDADVEAAAGRTVPEIFVEEGESGFRVLERAAAQAALAEHAGVLVLGGGAVTDPGIEAALGGRTVVFLDVDIADAARRLGFNRERPAGLGSPRAVWLKQMEQRRPLYRRLATVTVATDGLDPDEVAAAVVAALRLEVEDGGRR
jgi:shikimate kinase